MIVTNKERTVKRLFFRNYGVALTAGGLLGPVVLDAPPAGACSLEPLPPALVGYPDEGAIDVPTDVLPIYAVGLAWAGLREPFELQSPFPTEGLPASFELVDNAGAITPLFVGGDAGSFVELVPETELTPMTHYVLRSLADRSVGDGLQLSFTTGDGPLTTLPAPPVAALQHYSFEADAPTSCSPLSHGTCIYFSAAAPAGVYIEGRQFQAGTGYATSSPLLSRTPFIVNLSGMNQGTHFDCIELRNRAPNGTFSDSITRCRGDGELQDIRGSEAIACTEFGMAQDGQLLSTEPAEGDESDTAELADTTDAVDRNDDPAGSPTPATTPDVAVAALSADRSSCSLSVGDYNEAGRQLTYAMLLVLLAFRRTWRQASPSKSS